MTRVIGCCAAAVLILSVPLAAQVNDTSPFRPLGLPTPKDSRSASGVPGHSHWRSRADCEVEAVLDTAKDEIGGSECILYQSDSPDLQPLLWMQLDQNGFARGSRTLRVAPPPLAPKQI